MMRKNIAFRSWTVFFTLILPAWGVFAFLIDIIWNNPTIVPGVILALSLVGNIVLRIAKKLGAGVVGTITVDTVHPEKDVFRIDLGDEPLLMLSGQKEISLLVVNSQ